MRKVWRRVPGEIQVSAATRELLRGKGFSFTPRGTIAVKGKGEMDTFLLVGLHPSHILSVADRG